MMIMNWIWLILSLLEGVLYWNRPSKEWIISTQDVTFQSFKHIWRIILSSIENFYVCLIQVYRYLWRGDNGSWSLLVDYTLHIFMYIYWVHRRHFIIFPFWLEERGDEVSPWTKPYFLNLTGKWVHILNLSEN